MMVEARICDPITGTKALGKGDSGSPAYSFGVAIGVYSGGNSADCRAYITLSWMAENATGTRILTTEAEGVFGDPTRKPGLKTWPDYGPTLQSQLRLFANPRGLVTEGLVRCENRVQETSTCSQQLPFPGTSVARKLVAFKPAGEQERDVRIVGINDAGMVGVWTRLAANCVFE